MIKHTLGKITGLALIGNSPQDNADATHATACWNACDGIYPETVPELLKVLEEIQSEWAMAIKDGNPHAIFCSQYIQNRVNAVIEKAKTATT